MSEEPDKPVVWSDPPPRPNPGFEADVIRELERLVTALPPGTARMLVSRIPGLPNVPEPSFEITPRNPEAARFAGYAVATDLDLVVGEAEREFIGFARGGNVVRGASWQDELRWIWRAVLAGGFTQRHYLDSRGRVIGWAAKLLVNGKELVFRNGRRAEKLFGPERVKTVTYEPYIQRGFASGERP